MDEIDRASVFMGQHESFCSERDHKTCYATMVTRVHDDNAALRARLDAAERENAELHDTIQRQVPAGINAAIAAYRDEAKRWQHLVELGGRENARLRAALEKVRPDALLGADQRFYGRSQHETYRTGGCYICGRQFLFDDLQQSGKYLFGPCHWLTDQSAALAREAGTSKEATDGQC